MPESLTAPQTPRLPLEGQDSTPLPRASDGDGGSESPAQGRLRRLLNYIGEQLNDIDPRTFKVDGGYFTARPSDLVALPGLRLVAKTEGDHVWLRIEHLAADRPPKVPEVYQGIIQPSPDPDGAEPRISDAAFKAKLEKAGEGLAAAVRQQLEARSRAQLDQTLAMYRDLWKSWAEGERPPEEVDAATHLETAAGGMN